MLFKAASQYFRSASLWRGLRYIPQSSNSLPSLRVTT